MVGTNFFAQRTNNDGNQEWVALTDENGLPTLVRGTVVPVTGSYAKGCIFIKTDAASGVKSLYENQGTTTSPSFNLIGAIEGNEITLADAKILVGNSSGVADAVAMSGDATIDDAGVLTIGDKKIVTAKIGDAAITPPKVKTRTEVALGDADATLTATQLIDSSIFTITPTAARTLTTDTAANLVAGMSGYQAGTWFDFTVVNLAAYDVTLAGGTGVTIKGSAVVNNASATFRARFDSATAVTIYRI